MSGNKLQNFAKCTNLLVRAEWRNGRRWGLKIPCPLWACGFESHLGYNLCLVNRQARRRRTCGGFDATRTTPNENEPELNNDE